MPNRTGRAHKPASKPAKTAKGNKRPAKKRSDSEVQVPEDDRLTPAGRAMSKFICLVLGDAQNSPVRAAIGRAVIVAFDEGARVSDKASPQVLGRKVEPPTELVSELGPKVDAVGETIGLLMPATGRTSLPSELETALHAVLDLSHKGFPDSEAVRQVMDVVQYTQPRPRGRAVNYARRKAAIAAWEMHIQSSSPSWQTVTNKVCPCGKERHSESCKKSLLIEIRRIKKLLGRLGVTVPSNG